MTDIPHAEATKLNGGLLKAAETADILAIDLASVRRILSGCVEIAGDYATDEQGNVTNPGLARQLQAMRDELGALEEIVARSRTLAGRLDRLEDAADDLAMALDDLQYTQGIQQDLAEMALDVERGIRDPEELSRLVHDCAGLAL